MITLTAVPESETGSAPLSTIALSLFMEWCRRGFVQGGDAGTAIHGPDTRPGLGQSRWVPQGKRIEALRR